VQSVNIVKTNYGCVGKIVMFVLRFQTKHTYTLGRENV